ncbi:MAG TPA: polyphenol oxidase family protein [Candidatus Microsaccharimonas sp.]|jgi:copper oxidase (laccase) domain-containing protein
MTRIVVATSTVADGSMFQNYDPENATIVAHRKKFLETHDISIDHTTRLKITYDTTDFCRYSEVTSAHKSDGMYGGRDVAHDALVTKELDHALFLPVADCVAATFYDPIHQVLGLAHLGRHSLEQNGGEKFVAYLKDRYESDPKDIEVWLGPAPGKDAYQIWTLDNKGMKEATLEQLRAAGIQDENITDTLAETDKDATYFSHSEFLKGNQRTDGDHAMVAIMRA